MMTYLLMSFIYNQDDQPIDSLFLYEKCVSDAMVQVMRKSDHSLPEYYSAMGYSQSGRGSYKKFQLPKNSDLHIFLNFCGRSMVDILRLAGISDVCTQEELSFLNQAARLRPKQLTQLNQMAIKLSNGWQFQNELQHIYVPGRRLQEAVKHIYRALDVNVPYPSKTYSSKIPSDQELAEFVIQHPYRALGYIDSIPLRQTLQLLIARRLDISPRWLAAYSEHINYFGYSEDVENFYDNWTLLNEDSKGIVSDRMEDFLRSEMCAL